jgi:hypothetical protein
MRGKKSEVRGQRSEVRGQKAEGRRQKAEGRRQTAWEFSFVFVGFWKVERYERLCH